MAPRATLTVVTAARNLADVLRAVAERVERGAPFPEALRDVASEIDAESATPDWHLAAIDDALTDENIDEPWDAALARIRSDITRA